jgi:type IV fimbrial biogenesis protein FimT
VLAMMTNKQRVRGFTLIELMVTLAIAAVLLLVAIPSMTAFKRNAELTSATNTLLASINAARGEAMKRGTNAMVVPANGSDWNTGWIVFVYKFGTARATAYTYDATYDTIISSQAPLPGYINIAGNGTAGNSTPYIMFDASGFAKVKPGDSLGNLTFSFNRTDVTGTELAVQTRRIKIARTGRTRVCTPASDSTCTTSTTNS